MKCGTRATKRTPSPTRDHGQRVLQARDERERQGQLLVLGEELRRLDAALAPRLRFGVASMAWSSGYSCPVTPSMCRVDGRSRRSGGRASEFPLSSLLPIVDAVDAGMRLRCQIVTVSLHTTVTYIRCPAEHRNNTRTGFSGGGAFFYLNGHPTFVCSAGHLILATPAVIAT